MLLKHIVCRDYVCSASVSHGACGSKPMGLRRPQGPALSATCKAGYTPWCHRLCISCPLLLAARGAYRVPLERPNCIARDDFAGALSPKAAAKRLGIDVSTLYRHYGAERFAH